MMMIWHYVCAPCTCVWNSIWASTVVRRQTDWRVRCSGTDRCLTVPSGTHEGSAAVGQERISTWFVRFSDLILSCCIIPQSLNVMIKCLYVLLLLIVLIVWYCVSADLNAYVVWQIAAEKNAIFYLAYCCWAVIFHFSVFSLVSILYNIFALLFYFFQMPFLYICKALCVYVCMLAYNLGSSRALASKFSGYLRGATGIILGAKI